MTFQAIVHAPVLRRGARLNIADLGQTPPEGPKRLSIGAAMDIRFGVCCPDLAQAIVIDYVPEPESAVIAVDGEQITICHRPGVADVTQPGLESESWFVS